MITTLLQCYVKGKSHFLIGHLVAILVDGPEWFYGVVVGTF